MSLYKNASLVMIPSAYKDGKLYSIRPTDGSGDFTFSRGSNLAATRVDVNGLIEKGRENLFIYSNDFNSGWSPKAGTFTQGVTDPNGGSTAWSWTATNTDPYLYQYWGLSGVHCISVWAKGVGSTIGDNIELRIGGSINYFTLTSEWQRFEAFAVLNGATNIGFEYGNPTATSGDVIHIYGAQLELGLVATDYIETGASTAQAGILEDMPRLDYSGGASCPSLLLEPQRSNLVTHSEYLDGLLDVANGSVSYNTITSPEGLNNAALYTEDSSTNAHYIDSNTFTFTSGQDYVISVFAKYNGRFLTIQGSSGRISSSYGTFNLQTGEVEEDNIGTASIENYGNGWYRCSLKVTATSTGSGVVTLLLNDSAAGGRSRSYTGDGTSGLYYYGFQAEQGSYPTSYIPTYGTSQTRSADICDLSAMSSKGISTNNNWTIVLDYKNFKSQFFATYFYSVGGEVMHIFGTSVSYRNTSDVQTYIGDWSYEPYNDGETPFKVAIQYDGVNLTMFHNGEKRQSVANSNLHPRFAENFNRLRVSQAQGPRESINQTLFFDTALTDSECIALTTL